MIKVTPCVRSAATSSGRICPLTSTLSSSSRIRPLLFSRDGGKNGFPVALELHRTNSLDDAKFSKAPRLRRRNVPQGRIVEDDVRRNTGVGGELAARLAQGIEHRVGRSFGTPPASSPARRRN